MLGRGIRVEGEGGSLEEMGAVVVGVDVEGMVEVGVGEGGVRG